MIELKDMLTFSDISELCEYIVEVKSTDEVSTIIANRSRVIEIMTHIILGYDVEVESIDVDYEEYYDNAYYIGIYNDIEPDGNGKVVIDVGKAYYDEDGEYINCYDYVMFDGEVNSRAFINIIDNPCSDITDYDWFVIDDETDNDLCDKRENDNIGIVNNAKETSEDTEENKDKNGKGITYIKDEDGKIHGFSVSASIGDSVISYSYYGTDTYDKNDIVELSNKLNGFFF